jgi:hypothetical protein
MSSKPTKALEFCLPNEELFISSSASVTGLLSFYSLQDSTLPKPLWEPSRYSVCPWGRRLRKPRHNTTFHIMIKPVSCTLSSLLSCFGALATVTSAYFWFVKFGTSSTGFIVITFCCYKIYEQLDTLEERGRQEACQGSLQGPRSSMEGSRRPFSELRVLFHRVRED